MVGRERRQGRQASAWQLHAVTAPGAHTPAGKRRQGRQKHTPCPTNLIGAFSPACLACLVTLLALCITFSPIWACVWLCERGKHAMPPNSLSCCIILSIPSHAHFWHGMACFLGISMACGQGDLCVLLFYLARPGSLQAA